MNNYPTGRTPYDYGASNLSQTALISNGKQDGYRQDRPLNGFGRDTSRFDPVWR